MIKSEFLTQNLLYWYHKNARDLPWRHTSDAYFIWVSEVILQQTRVNQGLPYYHKFLEVFPTVTHLAQAQEQEVLRVWQGLGYYSRARNMHHTAQLVVDKHKGVFPNNYQTLLKLKGIGPYTAAAVAAFSNNETVAAIDGNAYRVYSRYFGIEAPVDKPQGQKLFKELAWSLVPEGQGKWFNQAIMELGATICTPKQYQCLFCPLAEGCVARENATQNLLPIKATKVKVKDLHLYYLVLANSFGNWFKKRNQGGIWKGLFDLPVQVSEVPLSIIKGGQILNEDLIINNLKASFLHKLTHRNLFINVIEVQPNDLNKEYLKQENYEFYPASKWDSIPKPLPVSKILDSI